MAALTSLRTPGLQGALILALAGTPGAVQPLIGDLIAAEEDQLMASDASTGDTLGFDVAISGDTAIAGAYQDDSNRGAAYVFVRNGSSWTQQQKLVASDGASGDLFGCSVAISGDTAVVGARGDDIGLLADAGSAYVFVRSGTTWTQQQKLVGSAAGTELGTGVGISGDTVAVGAPQAAPGGAALVFVRSGTVWSFQQSLVPADATAGDFLGACVAVLADTVVAGAPGDAHTVGFEAGSAYVFKRTGTLWSQEGKLVASDAAPFDSFGMDVSLSGDTALAGAPAAGGAGAAYVFARHGSTWSEQKKLSASDGMPGDSFGLSVAVSGETALVGAPFDSHAAGLQAGSARLFARSGSTWTEEQKLLASGAAAQDWFGASCGLSGDTAVIGVTNDDVPGALDGGSAYAFRLLDCGVSLPSSEVVRAGTPPNPSALKPGETSGPVLGSVWDPFIDHTAFMPSALLDLLGVSTTATSIPTGLGTLLCGTSPFLVVASPAPGAPFEIQLPFACVHAGLAFHAQGASVNASAAIGLTNALDITVGTF